MNRDLSLATRGARLGAWLALTLLVPTATGCADPLLERQDIVRVRALGARYEAAAAPGRATAHVDDAAQVRWLVVGPAGRTTVSYGLLVCPAVLSARGIPECAGPPLEDTQGSSAEPSVRFQVPDTPRLLISAVFCSHGPARVDASPERSRCEDPTAEAESATLVVEVSDASEREPITDNHHPDLTGLELRIDDAGWPAPPSDAEHLGGSAGASAESTSCPERTRSAEGVQLISFTLPPEAREERPREDSTSLTDRLETLQVSHTSTAGHLARAFTVFEGDGAALSSTLEWSASPEGDVAAFFFVVRDLRGGVSWFERELCIAP